MLFSRTTKFFVLSIFALVFALTASLRVAAAAEPVVNTILSNDHTHEFSPAPVISQPFPGDQLWVPLDDLHELLGLELKREGVCVRDVCVPLDAETRKALLTDYADQTWIDLLALAAKLNQPVAAELEERVWSFGEIPAVREAAWSHAEAPDFALPNREGKEVKLSDFRGKKVLLLTWASWCACSLDLAGWEKVYGELKDSNFEIVAVAQDTGGEEAAGKFYDRAKASYTTLIDKQHTVSSLYQMVNVPMGVWIDEKGRVVRPAEVAYSDKISAFGISVEGDRYVDGLRDWVAKGEKSVYAIPADKLAERLPKADANLGLADAHFKLAVYLHEHGKPALAQKHWEESQRLAPDDWNYHRQDWSFRKGEAMKRWIAKFRALDGKPYYAPLDLPEVK